MVCRFTTADLNFPSNKSVINKLTTNENIMVAYTYNQIKEDGTFYVTGEEGVAKLAIVIRMMIVIIALQELSSNIE